MWNQEQRCQGFTDVSLSDQGIRQAKLLGRAFKSEKLDVIFSSDLKRAKKTAQLIAKSHKVSVHTDVRLREMNQGIMEGKNITTMLKDHPDILKQWMESPADVTIPGGESLLQLQDRGWHAFQEILDNHPEENIAIVAHNLVIVCVLCRILGIDLNRFRQIKQQPSAINEIEDGRHGLVIIRLNDTHHLSDGAGLK